MNEAEWTVSAEEVSLYKDKFKRLDTDQDGFIMSRFPTL
jgi:hypothetical protein